MFDTTTEAAVIDFQNKHSIEPTGAVDFVTFVSLMTGCNGTYVPPTPAPTSPRERASLHATFVANITPSVE